MYFKLLFKDACDFLLHHRLYKQYAAPVGAIPMPSEHCTPPNACTSGHARTRRRQQSTCTPNKLPSAGRIRTHRQQQSTCTPNKLPSAGRIRTHRQQQSTCTPNELPSAGRIRTHHQLQNRLKASFTIEAAVIVPLSLIIICAAILVSMHVHDLVVIRAVSISSVFEGYSASSDISDIKDQAGETLSARLIVTDNIEVTVESTSDDEYILTCESSSDSTSGLFDSYISSSLSSSTISINISNLNGRDTLLKYRAAKEGLLSVIGAD